MKRVYPHYFLVFVSVLGVNIHALEIVSHSKFPVIVHFICTEEVEKSIKIPAGASRRLDRPCCVTKIELQGYPNYAITQKDIGRCTQTSHLIIVPEIDQLFALEAYNKSDLDVLEFLLKNGLDPVAPLSTSQVTSKMVIDNNALRPIAILAPMSMLRGAKSGNGMQRYKALLPAAQFDQKTSMIELLQRYASKE